MILKVFSSLNDSTVLFPFENSSVLSRISGTYQHTWKRQTPFQEGDSVFKIPDSNLLYLMMHRLSLQLKGSDLQLKHRSSDYRNKDMSTFSKTEFLLLFCTGFGVIHCTSGMERSMGPLQDGLEACYHGTVPARRTLPSPETLGE